MTILLVEDSPERISWFRERYKGEALYITRDPRVAIEMLRQYEFDLIFLDHDLGSIDGEVVDAKRVAGWLSENSTKHPNAIIYIHSINYAGGLTMLNDLLRTRVWVSWIPYGQLRRLLTR